MLAVQNVGAECLGRAASMSVSRQIGRKAKIPHLMAITTTLRALASLSACLPSFGLANRNKTRCVSERSQWSTVHAL